jgi:patatin-related protein
MVQREIRLALVLNGGVSLAVWIGGVVAEIDRARRAGLDRPATDKVVELYRELLDLTGSLLRTDVIAGASAGGLNGCLLATAIVSGGTIDNVRDTWIDIGSFTKMLRSGLENQPDSLLKGDDYFLPQVEDELTGRLNVDSAKADIEYEHSAEAALRRVELFVTGTNLTGQQVQHRDDFDGTLVDHEHRALFWFRHEPELHKSTFADASAAKKLARVARSTASFPGAFEASFCRVEGQDPSSPSLSGIATFGRDAWVIDGGVLDNAPFRPALDAIRRAPASVPVRRILCYVAPYATSPDEREARRSDPPALRSVIGAAFSLPRDLTFTETIEEVADYKERVRNRRASRALVAVRFGDRLGATAADFYADYCRLRGATSADEVLRRFVAGDVGRRAQGAERAVQRPVATGARLVARGVRLPWIPGVRRSDGTPWSWGPAPIFRSALIVLDLLARSLAITPSDPDGGDDALLQRIVTARSQLSTVLSWTRVLRENYFERARETVAALPPDPKPLPPDPGAWSREFREVREQLETQNGGVLDLAGISYAELEDLSRLVAITSAYRAIVDVDPATGAPLPQSRGRMENVAHALGDGGAAAIELLRRHATSGIAPSRRSGLIEELSALVAREGDTSDEERLRRLLDLEVIYEALVPPQRDHDQTLLFLRLNAEAPCELAPNRDQPEDKLAGLGLAHFAAFYKRSWRANDWMWGRLDGAARLVDILIDPWAMRLQLESPDAAERLAERLFALAGSDDADVRLEIRRELDELAGWTLDNEPPTRLVKTRSAIRRRLQLLIARGELPAVAKAAREDVRVDDAAPDAEGFAWAASVPEMEGADDVAVAETLARLPLPRRESLRSEVGSNLLTRNVATVAAVAAAALAAPRGVPAPVRLVPKALRGLFLPFYALTWGLTAKRTLWRALTLVAVIAAVVAVAWGLLADVDARVATCAASACDGAIDEPPGWLHALAVVVLIGSLALGVLRGGWVGVVVAAGFGLVYLGLVLTPAPDPSDVVGRLWQSEPVLLAATALVAAGIIASVVARPLDLVKRLWRRHR